MAVIARDFRTGLFAAEIVTGPKRTSSHEYCGTSILGRLLDGPANGNAGRFVARREAGFSTAGMAKGRGA
jgi:hypothetical protein